MMEENSAFQKLGQVKGGFTWSDIGILYGISIFGFKHFSCEGQIGHVPIERILNIDPGAKIEHGKRQGPNIGVFITGYQYF